MSAIGGTSGRLWSLWAMIEFDLPQLIETAKELGRLREVYEGMKEQVLAKASQKNNAASFRADIELFEHLDLHMCRISAGRIVRNIDKSVETLVPMLDDLSQRMVDECSLRKFISLSVSDAEYIFPEQPLFGHDVEQKYPSIAFEIDEAGKCYGLSRPTAAVFHLMRTMEVAINAIGQCLGLPAPVKDAERNWGRILEKIKMEIDRRNKASPKLWSSDVDRSFFSDVHASLDAVRVAWRNTTMHVENKYTQEEAEHIFLAVKGLMKKLASRLDQEGNPKA